MQLTLATERLRLRPVTSGDLGRLHDLLTQPEVRRYLCDDAVLSREQVEGLMGEAAALGPAGLGLWSLLTAEGTWIGILGLQPVSEGAAKAHPAFHGEVEPLVALHRQAWGKGYATEALDRAVAYAAESLGRTCLVALVDEPNAFPKTASAGRLRRGRGGAGPEAPSDGLFPCLAETPPRQQGRGRLKPATTKTLTGLWPLIPEFENP
jgi:ribosomal-protein-alanine N-acetyltransferase